MIIFQQFMKVDIIARVQCALSVRKVIWVTIVKKKQMMYPDPCIPLLFTPFFREL